MKVPPTQLLSASVSAFLTGEEYDRFANNIRIDHLIHVLANKKDVTQEVKNEWLRELRNRLNETEFKDL